MTNQIIFVNGKSKCGCVIEFSDGGGEYSDVHTITPCAEHSSPEASLFQRVVELERSETQLIGERDNAESALNDAYKAVMGQAPEWSNWFSFANAIDEIELACGLWRNQTEDVIKFRQRIAKLEDENEYIRKRFKEADLLFGKNLLVMQAAIIDWRTTSDAKNGMAWIFNTLLGPGELPSEDEKVAQAYFDRKYAPIDEEMMALHKWFWERNKRIEAERTATVISIQGERVK
ncbi:ead/Ea22-like family protein [Yokenella regensburgei]|uniref:ead/Ea22-like family protein n=1 Tax=Yokenella regensburgei TaxID=158877 RepID=UPI003EDA5689